ncbi:DUF2207 domain-containing protein [Salisaeta longa]|uniref:DUF2207 domain-containing protein n=1 Tax=Salisaeta longa TaxID=503170 RepID=UPI0003B2FD0F|nr:DUF2207 domain-containing protein [Salisaeta longa]
MAHWRSLVLIFIGGLLLSAPTHAQDKRYALSNYDVRLTLAPDGTYRVVETIRFAFQRGSFTTATRTIPQARFDSLYAVQVTSPDTPITAVTNATDGAATIRWTFPKRSSPATFNLAYSVDGALNAADGFNVIDWQAIGDAWSVPIRDMDVVVSIPFGDIPRDSVTVKPRVAGTLARSGTGWTASFAHEALPPGEGYRVIVRFPQRIAVAASDDDVGGLMAVTAIGLVVLGLIGGVVALIVWRGPSVDPNTVPASRPPDLPLPHAAHLAHKNSAGRFRMFSAVLFDLAQRGHVTLHCEPQESWTGTDGVVTVRSTTDRFGLTDFEADLLDEVQQYDTLKAFGQQASSYQRAQMTRIKEETVARGWFEARTTRSNRLIAVGTLLVLAAIASPFLIGGWGGPIAAGGLGGLGLGALVAGTKRYVITQAGAQHKAEVLAYLKALREQLEAERDSDPVAAAERLLDHLPWLLLDSRVDKAWLDELKDALSSSTRAMALPDWLDSAAQATEDATSAAVAAFLPIYLTVINTSAATGAGAVAGAVAGGAAAGAGAAGGAGGGGGGAA